MITIFAVLYDTDGVPVASNREGSLLLRSPPGLGPLEDSGNFSFGWEISCVLQTV